VEAAISPRQKIATIFDWYERWFESPDFHGCLFQHAIAEFGARDHPVFRVASKQKAALQRRIRGILEGTMPRKRADGVASALLMLIEGSTLLAQMGQGKAAIRDARQAALGLLAKATTSP
jgi:hypothetical protein